MLLKRNVILMLSTILFFFSSLTFYLYSHFSKNRPVNNQSEINTSSATGLISADLSQDIGKVLCGEIIRERVPIKNISDRKLHLRIASTSCGCSEASLRDEYLNPGDKTYISVSIHISKKWKKGPFKETVAFEVADALTDNMPKSGSIETLEILGQIDPNEGIIPTTIYFGKVRPGCGTITKYFEIALDSSYDFRGKAAWLESHLECLDLNLTKTRGADKNSAWRGSISLDSNKLPPRKKIEETFSTEVQFSVGSKGKDHLLTLSVIGGIGDFVESQPNTIYWNKNNYDKGITLALDAVDKAKITVNNISCGKEELLSYNIIDNETANPKIVVTQNYDTADGEILRTQLRIEVSCGQEHRHVVIVPVLII